MVTFISNSPSETEQLGEEWGRAAQSGLVIGLSGDLGAGKTQLVKGLARGLNITERVHSPTFAIINMYSGGRLPLFHLDLYRLETPAQIDSAGIEEYLEPEGVTVIEWAERLGLLLRSPRSDDQQGARAKGLDDFRKRLLHFVTIESLSETARRITYGNVGH